MKQKYHPHDKNHAMATIIRKLHQARDSNQ